MKRALGVTLGLAVLIGLVFANALFWNTGDAQSAYEPTSISRYDADFVLDEDGDLHVTETLTVDFPTADRRGIFRFFDNADETAPGTRREPTDITVHRDGQPEPFTLIRQGQGRYLNIRIGDVNTYLPVGEHSYEIAYTMPDAIQPGQGVDASSQFYWQLIPTGWQQRIETAELTVHLPVASTPVVQCAVGFDATDGCRVAGAGTDTLVVRTGPLPAKTPVSIKTGLDLPTPAPTTDVPWPARLDRTLGTRPVLLGVVLLLTLGALLAGVLVARRTVESDPGFPLMYAPPAGIGPAQAAYVLTENTDRRHYVASLMHAAEHGAVDLTRQGDAWVITDKAGAEGWAGLDPISMRVSHLVGGPGGAFVTSPRDVQAGRRLSSEVSAFDAEVQRWARMEGLIAPVGGSCVGALAVAACFLFAFFIVLVNPFNMTAWALVPGAFAIAGLSGLRPGATTRRTSKGRELWSHVGGFFRVLSTPSALDRFEFSGRRELYTAYLPWAVAFGCADAWAAKYQFETGEEPPPPRYLTGGTYAGSVAAFPITSIVNDFDATVGAAISSYQATQRSSSSSGGGGGRRGGGGGFSGGRGGGGGGGGSW